MPDPENLPTTPLVAVRVKTLTEHRYHLATGLNLTEHFDRLSALRGKSSTLAVYGFMTALRTYPSVKRLVVEWHTGMIRYSVNDENDTPDFRADFLAFVERLVTL